MTDPIALLKQDHRDVAKLLERIDASRPGARRRVMVAKVTSDLRLHMQIEEKRIYPLVSKLVDKDDSNEASIEHGLVRDGLDQINKLVDEPGFGAAVAMLTAGIRHHVKEEETDVFPKLKKKLDRETLVEVGDEVVADKKAARSRNN